MNTKRTLVFAFVCMTMLIIMLSGCSSTSVQITDRQEEASETGQTEDAMEEEETRQDPGAKEQPSQMQTGIIPEQILEGETGTIHYSFYLPESYDESREYPLMMVMPGYDMMWFGEDSSGSNLNWHGFLCWTELSEDMIVVSAQLTDWHETSARQANELTEYFLSHFSVDPSRVYAAGYSAGGETMSQAVSMCPELYAAYLHGASQWDGDYAPIAENGVAVYIFMAENDEYYGSERAWNAYNSLHDAYTEAGWSAKEIEDVLQIQTPDNDWFSMRGISGNYHGGGNVVFDEADILEWVVGHEKGVVTEK